MTARRVVLSKRLKRPIQGPRYYNRPGWRPPDSRRHRHRSALLLREVGRGIPSVTIDEDMQPGSVRNPLGRDTALARSDHISQHDTIVLIILDSI